MSEQPSQPRNRRRGVRLFPALAAFTLVGLSLYASQTSQPTKELPPTQAGGADPQGDQALERTTKAVTAAKAFLDSLDAGQRAKAVLEFDSKKKAG